VKSRSLVREPCQPVAWGEYWEHEGHRTRWWLHRATPLTDSRADTTADRPPLASFVSHYARLPGSSFIMASQ